MAQLMICSSCKKHYNAIQNEKTKTYYKACNDRRHVRKQRVRRNIQQPNSEDSISTKVKHTTISIIIDFKHIRNNNISH